MKRMMMYLALVLMASLLWLPFSDEAMARGGVYFGGAVIGAPAYYPYPPYYPSYYAYPPPYPYPAPPPVAYAPPPVAYPAPIVGGIGIRIR